jgi:hypothetical protein
MGRHSTTQKTQYEVLYVFFRYPSTIINQDCPGFIIMIQETFDCNCIQPSTLNITHLFWQIQTNIKSLSEDTLINIFLQ